MIIRFEVVFEKLLSLVFSEEIVIVITNLNRLLDFVPLSSELYLVRQSLSNDAS